MAIAVVIDTWIFLSSVIGHSDRGSFRPRVDLSNVSPSRHQVQPICMHVATAHSPHVGPKKQAHGGSFIVCFFSFDTEFNSTLLD